MAANLPSYLGDSIYVEMEEILNASLFERASASPPAKTSNFNSEFKDILNASQIESDGFVDTAEEYYTGFFYSAGYRIFIAILNIIIKLVLNFVVFIAEIYLAYAIITIIRKFKQSDLKSNVIILNCCLITILSLAKTVLIAIVYLVFEFNSTIYYCLEEESQMWLENLYIIFGNFLSIDWLINNYLPDKYKFFYNSYWKIILCGIHIANACFWLISVIVCGRTFMFYATYYYVIILSSSLFVTIIYIIKCRRKANYEVVNTDYKLYISCTIIYSYLPSVIYILLIDTLTFHRIVEYILYETYIIPEFIVIFHPLIIIYILIRHNKYYKMSFDRISCKKSVTTKHEPIEEDDVEQQLNINSDQINTL